MATTQQVVEAKFVCVGNHSTPVKAHSHFHKGGPLACSFHYARARKAEMNAKTEKDKAKAVAEAFAVPAPNGDSATPRSPAISTPEDPVEIWLETAAKIRGMSTDQLKREIMEEYYNQTCPESLRSNLAKPQAH